MIRKIPKKCKSTAKLNGGAISKGNKQIFINKSGKSDMMKKRAKDDIFPSFCPIIENNLKDLPKKPD